METNFYPLNQRRLRTDTHIRELTASVKLSYKSFIQPLFVDEALSVPRGVEGMNNVQVDTIESVLFTIEQDLKNGISKFLLFPVPQTTPAKIPGTHGSLHGPAQPQKV